jgi:hypothetical protein
MSSELLAKTYLEDIGRLILSITEDSMDCDLAKAFIDKYVGSTHNLSHLC